MADPKVAQRAPYILDMEPGTYHWCVCGRSAKQPFCDGSHQGTEFSPLATEIETAKKVAWCGCKHSRNPPYCDGSHAKLL